MADTTTLQARLAEAEAALHQLLTGAQVASVSVDGRSVSYTKGEAAALRQYIAELKRQSGQGSGRRPLRPYF